MQNSLRMSSATLNISGRSGSQTTCTYPSRSRRSIKITPPWSRRRFAQPQRVTVWTIRASVTRPQYSVRLAMVFLPASRGCGCKKLMFLIVQDGCRRYHHPHGHDVFERDIHAHLQLHAIAFAHEHEITPSWVGGGGDKNADVIIPQIASHFDGGAAGDKRHRPDPFARPLHQ